MPRSALSRPGMIWWAPWTKAMGSLPSLESRTWPLSSFSVYSILTDEPFSTGGLDCAPEGAAVSSTNSATRVPRKRIVRPPSRCRELAASGGASLHPPSQRRQLCEGRPAATRASGGRLAHLGGCSFTAPEKDRGYRELAGGYC